ncbi:hypothetical protein HDU96_003348 [Phlyctochytrium bullatum]|nr:hypothetical protein HDU96_003348 [Phlyctochytrium bullatum]
MGIEMISIVEPFQEAREKATQEEEERLQNASEKIYYRNAGVQDQLKSFSQFPPNIYRRSLAATKIQRAWRRMRGRRERAKLRELQYNAATLIQRVARRKLRHLRARKEEAVFKIQKNWRRKLFIWVALMHLIEAVNKIIAWWRPRYAVISDRRKMQAKYRAVTKIQSVFRGYKLRKKLRVDVRQRLRNLGESLVRHRQQLFRVRAAYILQKAWRHFRTRKIRNDKIRTRNRAAAKIQALWKGYWVRSHIHLRFTYGEAVFLTAVCKALRNCHFIVKMYRPCGIVCPKRDVFY